MSRVFLISSNISTDPYPVYPLGMAIVAGALDGAGHEVRQFDFLVYDQDCRRLQGDLEAFNADVVCLSLRNIDNVDSFSSDKNWYLTDAKRLIETIRTISSAPVVVGGPAFSILPEEILSYLGADYGVVGEGEQAVPTLIDRISRGEKVEAITCGSQPLQGHEMGQPLLVPEFVDYYQQHSGLINLQTKRGCPFKCVYCTYPGLEGHRFRPRPVDAVVEDLARLKRDHATSTVFFTDSIFNDPQGLYLELAEEMVRRELDIRWCAFFRPQGLNREVLQLLKRAGLYAMEMGTDAACDTTLAGLDKGFGFDEVLACQQAAIAEQVPCAHFIMFGGPNETPETVAEGLSNIAKLEHCVVFAFSGIRILPKSRLLERAIADNVIEPGASLIKPIYYFSPHIQVEPMNQMILDSFNGRRDRIFPPSDGQEKMAVMNNFGFKGILWDHLIRFDTPGRRRRRAR